MTIIIPFHKITEFSASVTGGKFYALARLANGNFTVPEGICITVAAYEHYVRDTGLRERILMELNRKDFARMRWEEMWDAALRIRNAFLHTPIPRDLAIALEAGIQKQIGDRVVTVRSSAPGEDGTTTSFAGLHESYVNVHGTHDILASVVKVWASLWSDAALLYRRELGLDPAKAAMAVVVQEMIPGDRSGVVFSANPNDESQVVVEAVYGLNQGMVDGTIDPDRWMLQRKSGQIISHAPAKREYQMSAGKKGVHKDALTPEKISKPPVSPKDVKTVYDTAMAVERLFGAPQDVEWTFLNNRLHVLQSRPVTTLRKDKGLDQREWYLTLRRSFENLKSLRREIEERLIPRMRAEAQQLSSLDTENLDPLALAKEISRCAAIYDRWVKTYWDQFIPFAHGARLFGQFYNDAVKPDDPHEFMVLLADTKMESLKRNRAMAELAGVVRNDSDLRAYLASNQWPQMPKHFLNSLDRFIEAYGESSCPGASVADCRTHLAPILLEISRQTLSLEKGPRKNVDELTASFLGSLAGDRRKEAQELLELARASYQLRDDDNIHLAGIESQLDSVMNEGRVRLETLTLAREERRALKESLLAAEKSFGKMKTKKKVSPEGDRDTGFTIRPRQLIGQPAGPGVASGTARIVYNQRDLRRFKAGEVLICDAVDPTMTYVVPLCAAIVERRGGMLIHGAIIAREYGLPCVTGVPDVTRWIDNGESITVDGHLGIVIIESE